MDTVVDSGSVTVYGAYDLWELFEYGERISCKNPRSFLHFLASSGTRRVEVTSLLEEFGASFRVEGPIGDDGTPGLLEYRLAFGEAQSFGPEETKVLLCAISRASPERDSLADDVARFLNLRRAPA